MIPNITEGEKDVDNGPIDHDSRLIHSYHCVPYQNYWFLLDLEAPSLDARLMNCCDIKCVCPGLDDSKLRRWIAGKEAFRWS